MQVSNLASFFSLQTQSRLCCLFEKQLADAVTKHTEDGFERFSEDLRQEVSGIFALQITAVKHDCFCNEFVLRAASIAFVVFLHPLP